MEKQMKRNRAIDCLRGYACFLVLFGHVLRGVRTGNQILVPEFFEFIETFIWTFHVALFMFISGYVYRINGEWKAKGDRFHFLVYKLVNLGIPYFVFSVIYILLNSMTAGTNTDFSITDILWLYKKPVAQYWFLSTLFTLFVVWVLGSVVLKNKQIWISAYLLFGIGSLLMGNGFVCTKTSMILAFGLGCFFADVDISDFGKKFIVCIPIHILFEVIVITRGYTGMFLIDQIEEILGIVSSVALISFCMNSSLIRKFLLFVSRYSFQIYLLHTIFTSAIRIVLLKSGCSSYMIHLILGTAIGLYASVLAAVIASELGWPEFFFYPSRTIDRLKKAK